MVNATRKPFRAAVHARGGQESRGDLIAVHGVPVEPFFLPEGAVPRHLLVTFDDACEALTRLERTFVEPDGSFIRTGGEDGVDWQVEGVLVEQGPTLFYVEIWGSCPASALDELLAACCGPANGLVIHLLNEGVRLDVAEFKRVFTPE